MCDLSGALAKSPRNCLDGSKGAASSKQDPKSIQNRIGYPFFLTEFEGMGCFPKVQVRKGFRGQDAKPSFIYFGLGRYQPRLDFHSFGVFGRDS